MLMKAGINWQADAMDSGAHFCAAGIATLDSLAGGPPSTDLTYALPTAKSAAL
jgi:hypothetical protein